MTRDEVELRLNQGERLGFRKETENLEYLGWILLTKRKPPTLWPIDAIERPEVYERLRNDSKKLTATPYHIHIVEIKRDIHESSTYDIDVETRLIENHFFAALDDVEVFLKKYEFSLGLIQPSGDISAP